MNENLWALMYRSYVFPILLSIFSALACADQVAPSDRVTSNLLIREAPHSEAGIIGHLFPNQSRPLLNRSSSRFYYEIRLGDGRNGWVSKSWSRIVPDSEPPDVERGSLHISFFYVGQGDSTLIQCPNGNTILIDAGSTSGINAATIRAQLIEVMGQDRGLDTLIISHADRDHYNRLAEVLSGFTIDQIFRVGEADDYSEGFWRWYQGVNAEKFYLESEDFDPPAQPNSEIDCGEAETHILAANVFSTRSTKNAASIVLMVRFNNFEAVFTGDATHDTEDAILERYSPEFLDIDLLKIGHHGSLSTSTSANWANTLSPEIAVVSAGRNSYGHPRDEVIDRLEPHTIEATPHAFRSSTRPNSHYEYDYRTDYQEAIYSTRDVGKVTVSSSGQGWRVNIERVTIH